MGTGRRNNHLEGERWGWGLLRARGADRRCLLTRQIHAVPSCAPGSHHADPLLGRLGAEHGGEVARRGRRPGEPAPRRRAETACCACWRASTAAEAPRPASAALAGTRPAAAAGSADVEGDGGVRRRVGGRQREPLQHGVVGRGLGRRRAPGR
jgi:hypothetical protein